MVLVASRRRNARTLRRWLLRGCYPPLPSEDLVAGKVTTVEIDQDMMTPHRTLVEVAIPIIRISGVNEDFVHNCPRNGNVKLSCAVVTSLARLRLSAAEHPQPLLCLVQLVSSPLKLLSNVRKAALRLIHSRCDLAKLAVAGHKFVPEEDGLLRHHILRSLVASLLQSQVLATRICKFLLHSMELIKQGPMSLPLAHGLRTLSGDSSSVPGRHPTLVHRMAFRRRARSPLWCEALEPRLALRPLFGWRGIQINVARTWLRGESCQDRCR